MACGARRVGLAVSEAEEVDGDAGEAGALGGDAGRFLPDAFAFHFSKNVSWPGQSSSTSSETCRASEQPAPCGRLSASAVLGPLPLPVLGVARAGQRSYVSGRLPPAPLLCLLALEFLQDLDLDTLGHTRLRPFRHIHSLFHDSLLGCHVQPLHLVSPVGIHCFELDGSHGFSVTTVASSGV